MVVRMPDDKIVQLGFGDSGVVAHQLGHLTVFDFDAKPRWKDLQVKEHWGFPRPSEETGTGLNRERHHGHGEVS